MRDYDHNDDAMRWSGRRDVVGTGSYAAIGARQMDNVHLRDARPEVNSVEVSISETDAEAMRKSLSLSSGGQR